MAAQRKKPPAAEGLVSFIFDELAYFEGRSPAIPWLWEKGKCRLFLVLGENAGGKSFFRRLVCGVGHKQSVDPIHLSMQGRATEGFQRAFIYGSEDWQATGEISCHTVAVAINTCRAREEDHLLYWDEPDVGLSDGAVAGVGLAIADFVEDLPAKTVGVFITTHSRELVRRLVSLEPHYIHLGAPASRAPKTLQAWLERPVVPVSPAELQEESRARFKKIQKILNERKR